MARAIVSSRRSARDVPGVHRRPDTGDPAKHDHIAPSANRPRTLDLKVILHRGPAVRQGGGIQGQRPARARRDRRPSAAQEHRARRVSSARPYLFMTDAAATGLGLEGIGLAHGEAYPGALHVKGRIVELGGQTPEPGDT